MGQVRGEESAGLTMKIGVLHNMEKVLRKPTVILEQDLVEPGGEGGE